FMKDCHSNQVKLVLDSSHAFYGGENIVDVVQLFGKDLVHVHFEDCLIGAPESRTVPGKGDVDLISFYQSLKEIGYDGYLTVELWGSQPERYAREALENTKKIISCCQ
ncbi:MAG: sugar phosphate isomerase/epimerase, partial [Candidatus Atribacteria bacterium]|nr:sugar phosphate isomerase/epimerase [Candidatus Atribacteria bacterium]